MEILHLSDLHFVDGDTVSRVETHGHPPFGNGAVLERLDRLQDLLLRADVVVLSGDTTDSGTEVQWQHFLNAIGRFPGLCEKILLVPGNHDLNHVSPGLRVVQTDNSNFDGRQQRTKNFLKVWAQLGRNLRSGAGVSVAGCDIDGYFPEVQEVMLDAAGSLAFISINTVAPSINTLGNAVGRFITGPVLSAVQKYQHQGSAVVIVGHHHPLPHFDSPAPNRSALERLSAIAQGPFMEAIDGRHFLSHLSESLVAPALYLHGHKHIFRRHVDQDCGLYIAGAPSLLFGDESTRNEGRVAAVHRVTRERGYVEFISMPVDTN